MHQNLNNYANFPKGRVLDRTNKIIGRGLIISEGNFHRQQRQLINSTFHRQRITGYGEVMVECAARLRERWQEGQTVEVADEMRRLTVSIVGKTLFGHETEDETEEICAAVLAVMKSFRTFKLPTVDFLERILPQNRGAEKASAKLEGFINRLIAERRQSGEDWGDLISLLLNAQIAEAYTSRPEIFYFRIVRNWRSITCQCIEIDCITKRSQRYPIIPGLSQ